MGIIKKNTGNRVVQSSLFNIDDIARYTLYIKPAYSGVYISVFDTDKRHCLYYEFALMDESSNFVNFFPSFVKAHAFLAAGYWRSVTLIDQSRFFTLVPSEFFEDAFAADYLKLNVNLPASYTGVHSFTHKDAGFVNVFAPDKTSPEVLRTTYPATQTACVHYTSCLIEGIRNSDRRNNSRFLHLFIEEGFISLLFFRNGYLHYTNSFPAQNTEEIRYYTLFVAQELDLIRENLTLVIYTDEAIAYNEVSAALSNYFGDLVQGARPEPVQFSYQFDELPEYVAPDVLAAGLTYH